MPQCLEHIIEEELKSDAGEPRHKAVYVFRRKRQQFIVRTEEYGDFIGENIDSDGRCSSEEQQTDQTADQCRFCSGVIASAHSYAYLRLRAYTDHQCHCRYQRIDGNDDIYSSQSRCTD